jgi:transcriptional regulator with XRE-family HTH domain
LSKEKNKYQNNLLLYRRRMGLTQVEVLRRMGTTGRTKLWELEAGISLPTLLTSLKLAAIYRVPVDFLYLDIYKSQRFEIRKREEQMPVGQQGVLPLVMR